MIGEYENLINDEFWNYWIEILSDLPGIGPIVHTEITTIPYIFTSGVTTAELVPYTVEIEASMATALEIQFDRTVLNEDVSVEFIELDAGGVEYIFSIQGEFNYEPVQIELYDVWQIEYNKIPGLNLSWGPSVSPTGPTQSPTTGLECIQYVTEYQAQCFDLIQEAEDTCGAATECSSCENSDITDVQILILELQAKVEYFETCPISGTMEKDMELLIEMIENVLAELTSSS